MVIKDVPKLIPSSSEDLLVQFLYKSSKVLLGIVRFYPVKQKLSKITLTQDSAWCSYPLYPQAVSRATKNWCCEERTKKQGHQTPHHLADYLW